MSSERRIVPLALAAMTVLAFALRVPGITQALAGDEYFTHTIVTRSGLRGVLSDVYHTSITPPLHYAVAWLFVQFGGDTAVLIRVPSLILGTALVPMVFLLARRAGGAVAGLLAAGLVALGPFSIWYADEARAYALMMFLVALSTYALLRALDSGRRAWWALYAFAACAALWSHYTAVFVVVAEAGWALWTHRDRWRALLMAQAAIAVAFLPWVPGFLEQRKNHLGIEVIGALTPQTPGEVLKLPLRLLVGHPAYGLGTFPGTKGLVLVAVVVLVAAAALWRGSSRRFGIVSWLRSERGLMAILAFATPIGLVLYALAGNRLFIPRNLSASLPALAALVAIVLTDAVRVARLARPAAILAFTAVLAVLAFDAAEALDVHYRRAPFTDAAAYIDRVSPPQDPVVELVAVVIDEGDARLPRTLTSIYYKPGRRIYPFNEAASAWSELERGRDVFVVTPARFVADFLRSQARGQVHRNVRVPAAVLRRVDRLGGPDGRAIPRARRVFQGSEDVLVQRYRGRSTGRLRGRTLTWSQLGTVPVVKGAVRGEAVASASAVSGWATTVGPSPAPAEWLLGFRRGRLVSAATTTAARPDVAQRFGPSALLSGFGLAGSPDRVFAIAGGRATELPLRHG